MLNAVPMPTGPMDAPGGASRPGRVAKSPDCVGREESGSFASTLASVRDGNAAGEKTTSRRPDDAAPSSASDVEPANETSEEQDAGKDGSPSSPEGPAAVAAAPTLTTAADAAAGAPDEATTTGNTPVDLPGEDGIVSAGGAAKAKAGAHAGAAPNGPAKGAGQGAPIGEIPDTIPVGDKAPAAAKAMAMGAQGGSEATAQATRVPADGAQMPVTDDASGHHVPTAANKTAAADKIAAKAATEAGSQEFTGKNASEHSQNHAAGARPEGGRRGILQETAQSDVPEAAAGRASSREAAAEPVKSFGDALREATGSISKDDHAAPTPRHAASDSHPSFAAASAGGKPAAAASAGNATAAPPPTAEAFAKDNFHQMVERALFSVRGGQSEARIALKPDHLGHVRMQIVTEHQMVSIRIVTESPAARDLIDANAHQLKNELQQQGLNVDAIEVSVSDDDGDAYRGARQRESFLRHLDNRRALPSEEGEPAVPAGNTRHTLGGRRVNGIDYFA